MNIILIGFKASGKSTLGPLLAQRMRYGFVDTDDMVEQLHEKRLRERLSCREIYRRFGAGVLRGLETEALRGLAGLENVVVATGGGVVLKKENHPLLSCAGLRVFLDVPLAELERRLVPHASAPLFKDKGVAALHEERYPLYLEAADLRYAVDPALGADESAGQLHALIRERLQENPCR